jgi:hypothetical protein
MKIFSAVLKILAALATIAGAVYLIATYGDKIVAWAKGLMSKCDYCAGCECNCDGECTCEDDCACCDCECDCECEEAPAEEAEAAEEVAAPAEEEVVAAESDFEG